MPSSMMRRYGARAFTGPSAERLIFSISSITVFSVKSLHIWLALPAFSYVEALVWGSSFYVQELVLLLLLRGLLSAPTPTKTWLQSVAYIIGFFWTTYLLGIAATEFCFFVIVGSEVHWSNATAFTGESGGKMALTGLIPFVIALAILIIASWMAQNVCFETGRLAIDTIELLLRAAQRVILERLPARLGGGRDTIPYQFLDVLSWKESEDGDPNARPDNSSPQLRHKITGIVLAAHLLLVLTRPSNDYPPSLYLTAPLLPLAGLSSESEGSSDVVLPTTNGLAFCSLNSSAISDLPEWGWLPQGPPLDGFTEWYTPGLTHYNAHSDPIRITNLDDNLLPGLTESLKSLQIRHVMVIMLESTRADVFPLAEESNAWKALINSYPNTSSVGEEANLAMKKFTKTAKHLTGWNGKPGRGGIHATNALTTASYTLKSMVGTLCGISPMLVDFAVEHTRHPYQPCLPQIMRALNMLEQDDDLERTDSEVQDPMTFKWSTRFMQSVVKDYDYQDILMEKMGYLSDEIISKEYLRSYMAKFGRVTVPDVNCHIEKYYGMPEVVLEKYIKDAFASATENNERLFLTHLTSTAHHPFAIPKEDPRPLPLGSRHMDLWNYLTSVNYVDEWLGTILRTLDEENVANDTLVVFVGDHGLSIAENNAITPYENAHKANFHIPLIFSHPQLPQIRIDDAVSSLQILPSILDLLQATDSLPSKSKEAARDLMHNYEGQSLLRPLRTQSAETNHVLWQFAISNPGGRMLLVRDARQPERHLIFPLVQGEKWRYTDVVQDPDEVDPVLAFSLDTLVSLVGVQFGNETGQWIYEAVCVTEWWIKDNHLRWNPPEPLDDE
ncbi:alkaline-phosphatase-like protein [Xylariaceae sp. FL1019]|nr:alkaline-phosphatase-like protein [Xylariaceae sp. FL1019]